MLRTAPPPSFWLRRVSETAAGFYMRRLTHGRCGGGGVLCTAPPPPFLGCAASERRRLVSACVDARARRGRASHITASPLFVAPRQLDGGLFLHAYRRTGAAGACFAQPRLPLSPLWSRRVSETTDDGCWFLHAYTHRLGGGVPREQPCLHLVAALRPSKCRRRVLCQGLREPRTGGLATAWKRKRRVGACAPLLDPAAQAGGA